MRARSHQGRIALALVLSGMLHASLAIAPEPTSSVRISAVRASEGEVHFLASAPSPTARVDEAVGTQPKMRATERARGRGELRENRRRARDQSENSQSELVASERTASQEPSGAAVPDGARADSAGQTAQSEGEHLAQTPSAQNGSGDPDPSRHAQNVDLGGGSGASASDSKATSGGARWTSRGPGRADAAPIALDSNTPPIYPRAARRAGLEGVVIARIVVAADGRVADVEVVAGPEIFHDVVRHALLHWRYVPAMRGGVPVSAARTIELPFSLR